MKEVTKDEFRKVYFEYGRAEEGWSREYWDRCYENAAHEGMRYKVELPGSGAACRMMIVDDHSANECRLFFMTVDDEEAFFDHPGKR